MAYQSSSNKAYLLINMKPGEAEIKSQSVSTLSVIKQCISRIAADQNKVISIQHDILDRTVKTIIQELEAKFENSKTIALQVKVIDALKEIQNQEGGLDMLSTDKKDLLFNAEKIIARNDRIPKELDLYKSIIVNLYRDYRLLKGYNSTPKMDDLKKMLDDFDADRILNIILS